MYQSITQEAMFRNAYCQFSQTQGGISPEPGPIRIRAVFASIRRDRLVTFAWVFPNWALEGPRVERLSFWGTIDNICEG